MKLAPAFLLVSLWACGSDRGFGSPNADDAGSGTDAAKKNASDAASPKPDTGATSKDASVTTSPSLEIVSGNGGVVPSGWPASDPVRVRARDANGNPVAGATITFTPDKSLHIQALSGNGTVTTDADGIAGTTYNAFGIDPNEAYEIDAINATWNALSAAFAIVITQVPSGVIAAPPLVEVKVPDTSPDLGAVKAGAIATGAIQAVAVFQQGAGYGEGIPGWGFRLTKSGDTLSDAEVSCAGGTAIADAKGNLSCDLVVPSVPGDYYFSMLAGGAIRWDGHVKVTP